MFTLISILSILSLIFVSLLFSTKKNVLQTKILNIWENNKFVKVVELLEEPFDMMCIIRPYSSKVYDSTDLNEVLKINRYLKKNNYVNDEGTWSLIISSDNNIKLFEFNRGDIDIVLTYVEKEIPRVITTKNCVKSANGYFYLFTEKERKYIILGDKK